MPQAQETAEQQLPIVAEDGTVEVTVERRRSLIVGGNRHLIEGDVARMPLDEARELDAAGFITPLDGSRRELAPGLSTGGPSVLRDSTTPTRVIGGGYTR